MAGPPEPAAPVAPRWPSVRQLHGQRDLDNYAWMRDHEAPAMRDYLAAERAYYDARTRPLAGLIEDLFAEAAGRTPAGTDESVAWTVRGYRYAHRTLEGAEGRQLLRYGNGVTGPVSESGPPAAGVVLLDEDVIGAATGYVDVGTCEPSPDDQLLAWSADTSGAEIYQLRFRDTGTGLDRPDLIERSYPGGAWAADSRQFFYLVPDPLNRPHEVWRHLLGTAAARDVLVYEETDERFELTVHASRSGELIVITAASRDTTEVRIIPAARPLADPVVLAERRTGTEYRIDHQADPAGGQGALLIVTDDGAPEFRLMRAPVAAPGRANWRPVACPAVAPARADTRLVRCDVVGGHLLLTLRRDGSPLLAIADLDGQDVREIPPAHPAGAIAVQHAEDYTATAVVVVEESLIEPRVWSALDLATGHRRELKRADVPGYDGGRYLTKRVVAKVSDGTGVPVTLAYGARTALDGSAPCLLYGYGAYEASLDPEFDPSLPSLLDRGVVYAVAHVRGGGECGRAWWQQGRLRSKATTFADFIDCASWLAGDAPGSSALIDGDRIVSRGLSAGGLLQGAAYSRAPQRWRGVVAEVPFVDCVTTMLDPGIPLTINEWDEWGDPRDAGDFACLRAYSPYDNPPAGRRPALLVTGAVHDPRVLVHEPAKWVARLRETDSGESTILFRAELGAGAHTGPSGRFGHLRYEAEVQAFVLSVLGPG
jgi:oligopeptidase B